MTGKKLVTLTLIIMFVLALMGGLAAAEEPCERYGQGYWKKWLSEKAEEDPDWECSVGFSAEELLVMLNTPARGDANQILVYQFIAASLNVSVNGCIPPQVVAETLEAAGAHLLAFEVSDDRSEILGWKDILEFWNENKQAVLESAVYEGICELFGSHAGETLTLTFSNDVSRLDAYQSVRVYFRDANSFTEDPNVVTWAVEGNKVIITSMTTFNNPRPKIGDRVMKLDGILDFIQEPVVVPDGGVEVEGKTYYYHWGSGYPYGATDVNAAAIVSTCGMEVWWYSDGSLIAEGWYYDQYSIQEVSGWNSGNPAVWNQPVKDLFAQHFPEVNTAWWVRVTIAESDVPEFTDATIIE